MGDTASPEEDSWLQGRFVACPHCQTQLYRVHHSPFYDQWFFYCDTCADRVVVSYYDPVSTAVSQQVDLLPCESTREKELRRLRMLEARLKPCNCGGRFYHNAPRRCHVCLSPVIIDKPGVDLWPECFGVDPDERELTPEDMEQCEHFHASHVRRTNIWK